MEGFSSTNEKKINQTFYELLRAYGISRQYDEFRLKKEWENVVGKSISRQTLSLRIEQDVLYVKLSSPALRQELTYARSRLLTALNKAVGKEVINSIVIN